MRAYSLDLRERIVAEVEAKQFAQHTIASLFDVSISCVKRWVQRKRELGHVEPLPHGGGRIPLLDEVRLGTLLEEVKRQPDATLAELSSRVPGVRGKPVSVPTMCRAMAHLGLAKKKESVLRRGSPAGKEKGALGTHGDDRTAEAPANLYR